MFGPQRLELGHHWLVFSLGRRGWSLAIIGWCFLWAAEAGVNRHGGLSGLKRLELAIMAGNFNLASFTLNRVQVGMKST